MEQFCAPLPPAAAQRVQSRARAVPASAACASATVLALEHPGPAIYNIVDDEPAPVHDWLPVLADALGAKPPRHLPAWLARLVAGPAAVELATQARGSSNAKAKRELGWTLRHPTWRTGFVMTYSAITAADAQAADAGAARARD